jgi:hypothetical protein
MVVAAGFFITVPGFGQSTFYLTTTGTAPVVTVDGIGVYAGVYGGGSTSTSNNPIICDDFQNEVGIPSNWQASAYQASTVGTTTSVSDLLFGGSSHNVGLGYANIGQFGYAEVAYLVNLEFNSSSSPSTQAQISEAIWAITDASLLGSGGTHPVDSTALNDVQNAFNYVTAHGDSLSQYTNLVIYTPNPVSGSNNGQEMWMEVPEGGTAALYLLLAGIACFCASIVRSRTRMQLRAA